MDNTCSKKRVRYASTTKIKLETYWHIDILHSAPPTHSMHKQYAIFNIYILSVRAFIQSLQPQADAAKCTEHTLKNK